MSLFALIVMSWWGCAQNVGCSYITQTRTW